MKLLVISPYFAPSSLVGAQRMTSLVQHLANRHEITVVSFSAKYLEEEMPGSVRAGTPENVHIVSVDGILAERMRDWEKRNAKVFQAEIDTLLSKEEFDLALVSCGPFFTLRFLPTLCKKYSIPYVIDYRDLNVFYELLRVDYPRPFNYWKALAFQQYHRLIEGRAARTAAAVIVVSPGDQKLAERKFAAKRVLLVYNGFDEVKLDGMVALENQERFTLAVFGKFSYYDKGAADKLFRAMAVLRTSGISNRLLHIGPANQQIRKSLENSGLDSDALEELGVMEYRAGMEAIGAANALVIDYVLPTGLGTKVFDYISLNKPILLIAPKETDLAAFVESFENGFVCQTVGQIADALLRLASMQHAVLDANLNPANYSRLIQNKRFEQILQSCVPGCEGYDEARG